jgi:hypothetical protein
MIFTADVHPIAGTGAACHRRRARTGNGVALTRRPAVHAGEIAALWEERLRAQPVRPFAIWGKR